MRCHCGKMEMDQDMIDMGSYAPCCLYDSEGKHMTNNRPVHEGPIFNNRQNDVRDEDNMV